MATNLLWFVLAGFLLGFATSTLWEWFYFRKERLKLTDKRIRELEAELRDRETTFDRTVSTVPTPASAESTDAPIASAPAENAPLTSAWRDPAYRSPGVFLETEEYEADGGGRSVSERGRPRIAPSSTASNISVVPPTVNSVATSPPESSAMPRNEPSPADALRARRGDSPRSRQEVLAALRRNSDPSRRGQASRKATESPAKTSEPKALQRESLESTSSETRSSEIEVPHSAQARKSTLVRPEALPTAPEAPTIASGSASSAAGDSVVPAQSPEMTPVRQRWAKNPALTRRSEEYPDDLSKIKGIGEVYKQRLYRAGIYTWKQIAESDVATLRHATSAYPSSNVDEWMEQAQRLMEKHGRESAVYQGPTPDDMTKILGIGPVSAAVLYRAGICTYEQLASTPIADLEALFPVAVAGDQPDFAQWTARAAALADEKHRDA